MKVSVIVPVYGVEKYLNACVESIVNQTYTELEIFLVDDGGKDNCPKMCDEWAAKDDRIIVIHKENGGQGTARNAALDIMTGHYVLFVDSDDRILPTMVEKMIDATDFGKIDLVLCGLTVNNSLRVVDTSWYSHNKLYSAKEILYEYLTVKKIISGPVCKLIGRQLIDNIRFPEFRANEDEFIMHEILGSCNSAYILNEHLYVQNVRDKSTEQSGFTIDKMHLIDCGYSLINYIEKNYPEYGLYVKDKVAQACMGLLDKMYREKVFMEFSECEEKIKCILSEEVKKIDSNTSIYRRVNMYLNAPFVYRCKININSKKSNIKKLMKSLIIKCKDRIR